MKTMLTSLSVLSAPIVRAPCIDTEADWHGAMWLLCYHSLAMPVICPEHE